ncbi:MAG: EAL domain-containing protein [Lachnospiraceae bacterium]|nr:EAL domain-containing protein [Lachnospiraceae bacterium]
MSKTKDERIRKLKKKRIWPSILGLVLILCLFLIIMGTSLAVSGLDIVQRKLSESSSRSRKVAELFVDYTAENREEIERMALSHIEVLEEMEAVAVADDKKQPIWSSSGEYPSKNEVAGMEFITMLSDTDLLMIPSDSNEEQVFEITEDEIMVNADALKQVFFTEEVDLSAPFTYIKLWFVIPVDGLEVMVLNNIPVYFHDFLMMVVSILLCSFLICIFVLYYVVSIISMVSSVRKTTKIIYTDMVTGGDNWLLFVKKGTALLKKNRRGRQNYAMIHLEMRKYRSFCTCFGVREGEALVEKFYFALKNQLKRSEVMAHQENAEFGLVLNYTDKAQLEARIRELENSLNSIVPGMKIYFGVGVYLIQTGEKDVEQLYNNAMIACEMLGEESENKIAFFDVEMNNQKLWERKVEDDMERALANKEFQVYLQPKISTSEEVLGGAEALVRWIHPTEGFIPPNRFIPIFEKNGFILKLDDYMLEEIARVQAQWLSEGRRIVPISVNISRAHFTREDLAEHICAIVDKYQVPHEVIELELTESAFFDDKKVLLNTVQKLRKAGFPVSMDDFGAGYSSLNSLKELQIDVLKIDADFFRGEDVEERGLLIVSEVIDLAKKLNMKIVAEGIESREQVEFLTEQECDLIQGYFYAKPMPIAEFVEKYK